MLGSCCVSFGFKADRGQLTKIPSLMPVQLYGIPATRLEPTLHDFLHQTENPEKKNNVTGMASPAM